MVVKTTTWRSSDTALSISSPTYSVEENIDGTNTILRINQNTFPRVLHGSGKGLSSCQLGTGSTARSRSCFLSARLQEIPRFQTLHKLFHQRIVTIGEYLMDSNVNSGATIETR